jgi:hypothetical protein
MESPLQSLTSYNPIKNCVEPLDYPTRWHVTSTTNDRECYLVDLSSYGGKGECQCRHYTTTIRPKQRAGEWATCKHIRAARELFYWFCLKRVMEADTNKQV